MRGYFGIGIFHPKTKENVGTLWRHANNFDADFIFTIGQRYKQQCSDTWSTPKHKPLFHYETIEDFYNHLPYDCQLVCIELTNNAERLPTFRHPERCVYLLGSEDHGLPQKVLEKAHKTIQIPTMANQSMNVATSGTIVMYDRFIKGL